MRRVFLIGFIFLASCKTWSSEDKDVFHESCMDEARKWTGNEASAKTYCDCVLEHIMKKYPDENDALEHLDSIINDPAINVCKTQVGK